MGVRQILPDPVHRFRLADCKPASVEGQKLTSVVSSYHVGLSHSSRLQLARIACLGSPTMAHFQQRRDLAFDRVEAREIALRAAFHPASALSNWFDVYAQLHHLCAAAAPALRAFLDCQAVICLAFRLVSVGHRPWPSLFRGSEQSIWWNGNSHCLVLALGSAFAQFMSRGEC